MPGPKSWFSVPAKSAVSFSEVDGNVSSVSFKGAWDAALVLLKAAMLLRFISFTFPDCTVLEGTRVKEHEIVPEWAGLMTMKSNDPV